MFSKVLAVCLILFLSISSIVHCAIWVPQNTVQEPVCRTSKCLKRGNEYFENLSPAVHPCEDFYTFVCGGWYTQHKPPEFLAEWSMRMVMVKRVIKDLKEILDKPANPSDKELTQVKYLYDICMKQPFLGRLTPTNVAKQITTVGRFGKKKLWDIHQQYLQLTGESPFFAYTIFGKTDEYLVPVLLLSEIESPYGAIHHGAWKPKEEKVYSKFLLLLIKSLKFGGTDAVIQAKINQLLYFREKLNIIATKAKERKPENLEPFTPHEFEVWFKFKQTAKNSKKPMHPDMPWEKIIKTILSPVAKRFHDTDITWTRDEKYYKDLEELISLTPEEVLVTHMEVYFAERHTIFTPAMEDLLEKTVVEPHRVIQPVRQDVPKYVTCIKMNNMYPQIGTILQRKWFRQDIVPPIKEMIAGLKLAIVAQIRESTWLSPDTKKDTIDDVLAIESWVGYPPWYSDPKSDINSEARKNNPLQADANLDLPKSVVYIKSPLLLPPTYDPDLPQVYNFGGIGYVAGHELYHIIQDCGMYNEASGKTVVWWPPEMRKRCKEQMKCFVDVYNSQTRTEFQRQYHEKIKGGHAGSFLENYPDVMGLEAAYKLFQAYKRKDKTVCQTLPRFEKYSCEQMFFIAFGNTMCTKITSKAAKYQVENSYHSLDSVRVNGAVMNNKDFAQAFQCQKAKPMNPDVKCNLWK